MSSSPQGVFPICAMVKQTLHLGLTCLVIQQRIRNKIVTSINDPTGHMSFDQHSHDIFGFAKSNIYSIFHRYAGATLPGFPRMVSVLTRGNWKFFASREPIFFGRGCRMAWVSPCSWADCVTPPGPQGSWGGAEPGDRRFE